jgi:toxin YoeB
MRIVSFHKDAFEQFSTWATSDKKLFKRLHRLIIETAKNPFDGIGKPKPLKGDLKGFWSRRINDEHRLVYIVNSYRRSIDYCFLQISLLKCQQN